MVNNLGNKYVPRCVFMRCQTPYDTPNAAASAMKRIAAPFLMNFIKDVFDFFCNIATPQKTKRKYRKFCDDFTTTSAPVLWWIGDFRSVNVICHMFRIEVHLSSTSLEYFWSRMVVLTILITNKWHHLFSTSNNLFHAIRWVIKRNWRGRSQRTQTDTWGITHFLGGLRVMIQAASGNPFEFSYNKRQSL